MPIPDSPRTILKEVDIFWKLDYSHFSVVIFLLIFFNQTLQLLKITVQFIMQRRPITDSVFLVILK